MLWVERYLRRLSSRVWSEGGLDAHILLKFLTMGFYQNPIVKNFNKISKECKSIHARSRKNSKVDQKNSEIY